MNGESELVKLFRYMIGYISNLLRVPSVKKRYIFYIFHFSLLVKSDIFLKREIFLDLVSHPPEADTIK